MERNQKNPEITCKRAMVKARHGRMGRFLCLWAGFVILPWAGGVASGQEDGKPGGKPRQLVPVEPVAPLADATFEEIIGKVRESAKGIRSGHFKFVSHHVMALPAGVAIPQPATPLPGPQTVLWEYWVDGENFRRDITTIQGDIPKEGLNPIGQRQIHCQDFLKKGQFFDSYNTDDPNSAATIRSVKELERRAVKTLENPRWAGLDPNPLGLFYLFNLQELFHGKQRKNGKVAKIEHGGEQAYRLTWELDIKGQDKPGTFSSVVIPAKGFGIVLFTGKMEKLEWQKKIQLRQVTREAWFPERTELKRNFGNGMQEEESVTLLAHSINGKMDPRVFQAEGMGLPEGKLVSNLVGEAEGPGYLMVIQGQLVPVVLHKDKFIPKAEYEKLHSKKENEGGK